MGFETEGCCRWCGEENETALHLLTKCPAWMRTRMKWFGEYLSSPDLIKEGGQTAVAGNEEEAGTMDFESTCQRRELPLHPI